MSQIKDLSSNQSRLLYYYQLGHIGDSRIMRLEINGILNSLDFKPYLICESYLQLKIMKSPCKNKREKFKKLLELIHWMYMVHLVKWQKVVSNILSLLPTII